MRGNVVVLIAGLFILNGCSEQAPEPEDVQQQAPAQQESARRVEIDFGDSGITPAIAQGGKGTVMAVQNVDSYTYLDVQDSSGARFWLAGNRTQLVAGDLVSWGRGSVMKNFHSKALGRDFDQILFVSSVFSADQAPALSSGRVVSAEQVAGYSYILVDAGGKQSWLAVPTVKVNEGDTVNWSGGSVMTNFHSDALGRDFASILFISGLSVVK